MKQQNYRDMSGNREGNGMFLVIRIKKSKSKAVPLHAMEVHGGRGGIAPTHT
jgi:hypothetical protein